MNRYDFFAALLLHAGVGCLGLTTIGVLAWWVVSACRARALPPRGSVVTDLWLIGLCAAAVAHSGYLMSNANPFNQQSFDRLIWLRAKLKSGLPARADDGKPRPYAPEAGHPSRTCPLDARDTGAREGSSQDGAMVYHYYLGFWSGLRLASDYLDVHFDASDRVTVVSTPRS